MTVSPRLAAQDFMLLQRACAYLFSPDHARNPDFLKTLNTEMIKQAFRQKARQYHPDLHAHDDPDLRLKRSERFVRIRESYEYLSQTIKPPPGPAVNPGSIRPGRRPWVIAVAGAKGGIGKSIFAANFAVYLSGKGIRTVALDLDLGGANLHLYLGRTILKNKVNDFLLNKAQTLQEILEPTACGPGLIGGDSSCLGAGNVGFARKLKLLKAIRQLDTDVVVADLGGDTAFNVLDFFLAADTGLVMTTTEPAAYLEAYAFIKVALYRRLTRIFGPESFYSGPSDPVLRRLIQDAAQEMAASSRFNMARLRERVERETRSGLRILDQTLAQYVPYVLVNKVKKGESALAPVQRIQEVSAKTLAVTVRHLGTLPFEPGIESSARTLKPFVLAAGSAQYRQCFEKLAGKLVPGWV